MSEEKIRVLIVEDSVDVREYLQRLIHYLATDLEIVALASNGIQGIDLAREHQPDVVLMDINMPDLDGIAATQTLLQESPLSKVILMSGHVEPEYVKRSMQAGAHQLITKPINGDELISIIRSIYKVGAGTN